MRLLLIGLMLASLLMAIAIPDAFGDKALLFAGSYVTIQVGRHLFLTFVAAEAGTIERIRAGRILIWFVAAGVLWIAGALADGSARTVLWLAALGGGLRGAPGHVLAAGRCSGSPRTPGRSGPGTSRSASSCSSSSRSARRS